jgi:hypothetical protein
VSEGEKGAVVSRIGEVERRREERIVEGGNEKGE